MSINTIHWANTTHINFRKTMALSYKIPTHRITTTPSTFCSSFLRAYPSQLSFRSNQTGSGLPKPFAVSSVVAKESMGQVVLDELSVLQRPDSLGRFGKYGGKYVPETLMYALTQLESAFKALATDHQFQVNLFLCFFFSFLFLYLY